MDTGCKPCSKTWNSLQHSHGLQSSLQLIDSKFEQFVELAASKPGIRKSTAMDSRAVDDLVRLGDAINVLFAEQIW